MKTLPDAVSGVELSNRRLGKKKIPAWDCICDCGTVCHPAGRRLREGRTISCGCYAREISGERLIRHNLRHGDHRGGPSPEYRTWTGIKARCSNPKVPCWKYYGGRGIGVCERWFNSFEVFLADMGRKPSPKHSIDRIDNDKGYSPVNCRTMDCSPRKASVDRQRQRGRGAQVQYALRS